MDSVVKPQTKYLEQPPADWFELDVMRSGARGTTGPHSWSTSIPTISRIAPANSRRCSMSIPRNIALETVRHSSAGLGLPASIEAGQPPGMR
jgi:hypothetical protein